MASGPRNSKLIAAPDTEALELLAPEDLTADERLQAEALQMKAALDDTPKNATAGLIAALGLAFLSSRTATSSYTIIVWIWFAVFFLVTVRAVWITHRFTKGPQTPHAVYATIDKLSFGGVFAGAVWGCSSWLMLPTSDSQFETLLIIVNAMFLMGLAASKAPHRRTLLQLIVPSSVLFIVGLIRLGDEFHLMVGFAFAVFTVVLLSFSRVQERSLMTSIQLRFKTERLLRERIEQQEQTNLARQEAEAAKEHAELANQGKTTFLTAAGHDLRQPMHALVQYFGHLKRRNEDPRLEDTILRIGKSLESMQGLLDTILEVSKLMMGSVKPAISTFSIGPLLERLDSQMRPIAEDKGLSLSMNVDYGDGAIVRTDQVMFERILRNLVINAIRYTNSGRVVVRAKRKGTNMFVQVIDTGIGIARADRGKIFEAFYQVSNEARDRRRGVGLGLAIVRQLSELLGVKVGVRSRERRGSIFRVEIPIALDPPASRGATVPQVRRDFARGAFVVLIDDNEESLAATAASLREFGCRVLSAHSGMQAIEKLQDQETMPQLVISDYRLEGETGLDAIKMVIDNQQALYGDDLDISAFIVSGDTAPAEMQMVVNAGYRMLHKPVPLESLYDAVNRELETLARSGSL